MSATNPDRSKSTRRVAWATMAAAATLLVLLGGCGRGSNPTPAPTTGHVVKSVAIVTPERAIDFGWNQQGVASARKAATKAGASVIVQDGAGYTDIAPILQQLAEKKPGLLIAWASGYNTVAPQAASQNSVPTLIVGAPNLDIPGLVGDVETQAQDGAYLAGVLAARTTRTDTVAIVVSADDENWTKMSGGFIAGVRSVNPRIHILYVQIGQAAYADAVGGRRVTAQAIAGGADVVFGMGDGSSFGMLQAVETATPPPGAKKVWFIDVIGDKSSLDKQSVYLSSVVWNFEPIYSQAIADLRAGTFGSHTYWLGLKTGLDLLKTPWIPQPVWAAVQKARQAIVSGSLHVPLTRTSAEVKAFLNLSP
jgi:basic membrane protein A